jgi:hypothetical protein
MVESSRALTSPVIDLLAIAAAAPRGPFETIASDEARGNADAEGQDNGAGNAHGTWRDLGEAEARGVEQRGRNGEPGNIGVDRPARWSLLTVREAVKDSEERDDGQDRCRRQPEAQRARAPRTTTDAAIRVSISGRLPTASARPAPASIAVMNPSGSAQRTRPSAIAERIPTVTIASKWSTPPTG